MKIHDKLLFVGFIGCMLITGCDLDDQSGKIPITSTTEEAVEWYQKGFSLENKYDIVGAEEAGDLLKSMDLNKPFNRYSYAKTNELLGNMNVAQWEYESLLSLNLINEIDYSLTSALILGKL